ncbi:CorA Metal Ion Transporter (MIT) Family [Thraustotheca clavata]|uniref:CorA Metal Ion Transporter (MIT) Family n=1 Tax=Thraustotheca clavata TaxID=74557 RepID=A0A1V9ZRU0_9STRA|nr:CorA Metal Ion Transporter (MIT) Family [Thraustotheca clavata]
MLVSKHNEIAYDFGASMYDGKRLVLKIDTIGNSEYEEITRSDLLKIIQAAAPKVKISSPCVHTNTRLEIQSIHMRDLRKLDNVFAVSNEPTLINGIRRILMEILENDEDMHMLYSSKIYQEPQLIDNLLSFDTGDAESLVEEVYASQTSVALMTINIQNTESMVMLKLDTKRNCLLTVDLI